MDKRKLKRIIRRYYKGRMINFKVWGSDGIFPVLEYSVYIGSDRGYAIVSGYLTQYPDHFVFSMHYDRRWKYLVYISERYQYSVLGDLR